MNFSNLNRAAFLNQLKQEHFDILIIGGGITGAGIALDAITRGMTVGLVEMQDFAAGTSSRSTKLIHGGLRYLKQFEIKMVAEVGKERAIVYANGPHVTKPEWMMLPIYQSGSFGKISTAIGLWVYDFLAAVSKKERRVMLTAKETLQKEPLLKTEGLLGAGYYVEYRTDDSRLTIEIVKEAVAQGAVALNYSKVEKLLYNAGKICGAVVADLLTGEKYEILAKKVVNATGPWVDELRELDHSKKGKTLKHTKGVHIVLDQTQLPLKQALYFDALDGRMVFAIPRGEKVYVGTTDTYLEKLPLFPIASQSDCTYLIGVINHLFPTVLITLNDIESSWGGVRPLIFEKRKNPSEISRHDEIWESTSGLLTIAGGKLTGYRKMAEKIVDVIAEKIRGDDGVIFGSCQTKHLPISGGHVGGSENFYQFVIQQISQGVQVGLSYEDSKRLACFYGSNIQQVLTIFAERKQEAEKYKLPYALFAKLAYAIEYEMIATPVDFFYRRTGDLLFNITLVKNWIHPVTEYMAERFAWSEQITETHKNALINEMNNAAIASEKDGK
jgi:glycerol-3-phosphate dehydrogenase